VAILYLVCAEGAKALPPRAAAIPAPAGLRKKGDGVARLCGSIVRVGAMCEHREEYEEPWKPIWRSTSRSTKPDDFGKLLQDEGIILHAARQSRELGPGRSSIWPLGSDCMLCD